MAKYSSGKSFLGSLALFVVLGSLVYFLSVLEKRTYTKVDKNYPSIFQVEASGDIATPVVTDLKDIFESNTGFPIDSETFGVYTIKAKDDELYFGISAGKPGNYDGALLVKYKDGKTTPILNDGVNPITEQGMHDMQFSGDVLYIPGTDPCCETYDGHEWDFGNLYTYDTSQADTALLKHRNLPNVIHTLGIDIDSNGAVYLGTGSHTGDYATWVGEVFKGNVSLTNPEEDKWENSKATDYRIYDIARINDTLIASGTDGSYEVGYLIASFDDGQTWNRIYDKPIYIKSKINKFKDKIIVINSYNDSLVLEIDDKANVKEHPVYGASIQSRNGFQTSTAGDDMFYVMSYLGIIGSKDLSDWYLIYPYEDFANKASVLEYWPAEKALVYSIPGSESGIYKVFLKDLPPPQKLKLTQYYYYSFGFNGKPITTVDDAAKLDKYLKGKGYSISQILDYEEKWGGFSVYYGDDWDWFSQDPFKFKLGEGYMLLISSEGKLPKVSDFLAISDMVESSAKEISYNLLVGYNFISFPKNAYPLNSATDSKSLCSLVNRNTSILTSVSRIKNDIRINPYGDKYFSAQFERYQCGAKDNGDIKPIKIYTPTGYFLEMSAPATVTMSKSGIVIKNVGAQEKEKSSEGL